jgi:hypothetical protein
MRIIFLIMILCGSASANNVRGYYRSNGTYVPSYQRSAPDSNAYNNYGYYNGTQSPTYPSQHYGNQQYGSGYTQPSYGGSYNNYGYGR